MAFTYRNLAYTTPSGKRFEFVYTGEMSDGTTHNLAEFQFASVDNKYFQDRTISKDEFPFSLIITDQATLQEVRAGFDEKAEPGKVGTLEHPDPTVGSFPAVVASIKYSQNSVKGTGAVTVAVVFYKTITNLLGGDPAEAEGAASISSTYTAVAEISDVQAEDFAEAVSTETGSGFAALISRSRNAVESVKNTLGAIAQKVDRVNVLFTNGYATVLSDIDSLARAPVDLARQVQNLIMLPSMASDSVKERTSAYLEYVRSTFNLSSDDERNIIAGNEAGKNTLSVVALSSLSALSAMSFSMTTGTSATTDDIRSGAGVEGYGYLSRLDIISAIQTLQDESNLITEKLSAYAAMFGNVLFFDQYFDYSVLSKKLIARTIKNLNARIFTAATEKIHTVERDTNPISLSAKLYNSIEVGTIQFLLNSNDLHGSEIYLIPRGTEIKYY